MAKEKSKEHDCVAFLEIDRDPLDYEFFDDIVRFNGQCSKCGRKGHEVFVYSTTLWEDEA